MKVIAKAAGFVGGCRRRKGDIFDVPDGAKAKWFEPYVSVKAPTAAPAAAPKVIKATKAKGAEGLV